MENQKQLGRVSVTVTTHPYILYETVELLRAFVNGMELKSLTREGPYCLTLEELQQIRDKVCGALDPSDKWLRHFFENHPLLDDSKTSTCLASCIAYSFFNNEMAAPDLRHQLDYVAAQWRETRRGGYQICSINRFSIAIEPAAAEEPVRLFEELRRLPISSDFCMLLYEAFSDLDFYADKLCQLISPAAASLTEALQPCEQRCTGLVQQWMDFFSDRTMLNAFLRSRTGTEISEAFEEMKIALRYFEPRLVVGSYSADERIVGMHVGIGVKPMLPPAREEVKIDLEQEFAAFKLLGDKGRRDTIRILSKGPLSMQDITNQLGINSGTVFRNINSLFQAGLLRREVHGERFYYKANLAYIQEIFDHMMAYFNEGI